MTTVQVASIREAGPQDLLRLIGSGSTDAFEALYDRLAPLVYGVARAVLVAPGLAERATAEVFLQVWQEAPRYRASHQDPIQWVLATTHLAVMRLGSAPDGPLAGPGAYRSPVAPVVRDRPLRARA